MLADRRRGLRPATTGVPEPPPQPPLSPEHRQPFVLATLLTLAMLAAAAVTLAWHAHGDEADARGARGHRGTIEAERAFRAVAFAPDGALVYAATGTVVETWHPVTRRRVGAAFPAGTTVTAMVVSPDGHTLVTAADDGTVQMWDTGSRRPLGDPLVADGMSRAQSLAISPDGAVLAAAGDGGTALWSVDTRAFVGLLASTSGGHASVAFSPDGLRVATGEMTNGTVTLWRTGTRQVDGDPLERNPDSGPVFSVAFDTSGTLLAGGSADKVAFVWNLGNREPTEFVNGHEREVTNVALTRDGRTLVTASLKDVRLWDAQTASQVGMPVRGDGSDDIFDLALGPDGDTLAIVRDHRVVLWSLSAARR